MTTITNISAGFRGLVALSGEVLFRPGETKEGLELSPGELKSAESTGYFLFGGQAATGAAPGADDLDSKTKAELEAIATLEDADISGAKKKAEIADAIRKHRLAKTETPPASDLDGMDDATLAAMYQTITGAPPAEGMARADIIAKVRE